MANVQGLELVGVWAAAVVFGLLLKQLAERASEAATVLIPVRKNDPRKVDRRQAR